MRLFTGMLLMCLVLFGATALAQDGSRAVTDDEVNAIASQLYCPVCENIPLDTCGTAACQDWREEIRLMLEQGMTENEIIDDFVWRFGDRVVGTPQDPLLRSLSLITPWVLIIVAIGVMAWQLLRRKPDLELEMQSDADASRYRQLLERDVQG